MSTPLSPGWYPAPDGNGKQWWNGAAWSEAKQNSDGTVPGLPGYQAAPPRGTEPAVPVPPPPPTASSLAKASQSDGASIVPVVFGVIGLTVFGLFSVIAIIAGLATFKSTSWIGRVLAGIGIILGVIGVVLSVISFIQSGGRNWDDLIF